MQMDLYVYAANIGHYLSLVMLIILIILGN